MQMIYVIPMCIGSAISALVGAAMGEGDVKAAIKITKVAFTPEFEIFPHYIKNPFYERCTHQYTTITFQNEWMSEQVNEWEWTDEQNLNQEK